MEKLSALSSLLWFREKLAIDLDTLRARSSGVVSTGIRGGMQLDPGNSVEAVYRRHPGKGMLDAGPHVAPVLRGPVGMAPIVFPFSLAASPLVRIDNRLLPGPLFMGGGRRGAITGILKSYLDDSKKHDKEFSVMLPASGLGKEVANRIGLLHEALEKRFLGKGITIREALSRWGNDLEGLGEKGYVSQTGGSHISPGVMLGEHNLVSTLGKKKGQEGVSIPESVRNEVQNMYKTMRKDDESWFQIQRAMGRDLPYGQQRFSRHAIRRILELMRK